MTDYDIVERAAKLLKAKVLGPYVSNQKKQNGHSKKQTWYICISGNKAAAWMMTLFAFFGNRRREQITALLIKWRAY